MADIIIKITGTKNGGSTLIFNDGQGSTGLNGVTKTSPADTVQWVVKQGVDVTINDIQANVGGIQVFSTPPQSSNSWKGTIGQTTNVEYYTIWYSCGGLDYKWDPQIQVNPGGPGSEDLTS